MTDTEAVAAERKRLLAELDGQFSRPRGEYAGRGFHDGWLTAIHEFRDIITNPEHQAAPLAEMVQRMRAGAKPETPSQWWDDGKAAGRAEEREACARLAEEHGATYVDGKVWPQARRVPFADLLRRQP